MPIWTRRCRPCQDEPPILALIRCIHDARVMQEREISPACCGTATLAQSTHEAAEPGRTHGIPSCCGVGRQAPRESARSDGDGDLQGSHPATQQHRRADIESHYARAPVRSGSDRSPGVRQPGPVSSRYTASVSAATSRVNTTPTAPLRPRRKGNANHARPATATATATTARLTLTNEMKRFVSGRSRDVG